LENPAEAKKGEIMSYVIGIDPGITGGIVVTDGQKIKSYLMPLDVEGKERRIGYLGVRMILLDCVKFNGYRNIQVFLERAVSFGMGTKAAFNYGRGFEAVVLAVQLLEMPLTLVEPGKWAKVMHAGISGNLKPKVKSGIAVKRLFPKLCGKLPTNTKGKILDGPMDALLIAGYGLRSLVGGSVADPGDFY
jgi:hypothetical protein